MTFLLMLRPFNLIF